MKSDVFVLLACLFVVMVGFGITLPVLPFYSSVLRWRVRVMVDALPIGVLKAPASPARLRPLSPTRGA